MKSRLYTMERRLKRLSTSTILIFFSPLDMSMSLVPFISMAFEASLSKVRKEGNTTPAIFLTSLNAIEDLEHMVMRVVVMTICANLFALKELLFSHRKPIVKREFFHAPSPKIRIDESIEYDSLGKPTVSSK